MIEVIQLTKIFDSRGIAGVRHLSFKLAAGEVAAVMGPNGSGKSTLLNLITGNLQADSGSIAVDGEIAYFQPGKYSDQGNVLKFLITAVSITTDEDKKVQLARDLAGLLEFTFQLKQDISSLSEGQKQKIFLSALLINRPRLILLDEPFTHLDPLTRQGVLSSLFDYIRTQDSSLLWVTHQLEEALLFSNQIGILNFGDFEQWGPPAEIIFNPKNLFVAQFVGYKNFVTIKYSDNKWHTPWGDWSYPNPLGSQEAIMVIPAANWECSAEAPMVTMAKTLINHHEWEVEVIYQERTYNLTVSNQTYQKISAQTTFRAKPHLADCFIIPL